MFSHPRQKTSFFFLKFSNMPMTLCLCPVRRRTTKPFRSSRSRFYLTGATRSTPACTASGYTGRPATSERAHTVELLESRAGWRQRRGRCHRSSGSDSPPALATRHRHFHLEVIRVFPVEKQQCVIFLSIVNIFLSVFLFEVLVGFPALCLLLVPRASLL